MYFKLPYTNVSYDFVQYLVQEHQPQHVVRQEMELGGFLRSLKQPHYPMGRDEAKMFERPCKQSSYCN